MVRFSDLLEFQLHRALSLIRDVILILWWDFGKISAQLYTTVKQICFPSGNVLFSVSLFSLVKNWMHNVVRGCSEILPRFWSRTEYGNLYPPQSFKIVAFYCRSTFVCTSRLMSTVVPSFNSTVPTTCFSFTTHVVLVFPLNSGETHLWKGFRKRNIWEKNLTHEETMKITLKNERQMKFSLFPMT